MLSKPPVTTVLNKSNFFSADPIRVGASRSQEGPIRLCFSSCRTELCQISLDTLVLWAFSRDILHPGSLDNICSREGAYV